MDAYEDRAARPMPQPPQPDKPIARTWRQRLAGVYPLSCGCVVGGATTCTHGRMVRFL